MAQLPAHLQKLQSRDMISDAMSGMSALLPPHISIANNEFTLVDATGAKQPIETKHLDICFVDISKNNAKQYYENPFVEGSGNPPDCWSANGIEPSVQSAKRQARTCAECQWNVRGSEISTISGKAIKACRDEKWTAVLVPAIPDMLWQFKITPGSFKNFNAFVERCRNQQVQPYQILTRLKFEKVGVITFEPQAWIDENIATVVAKAWEKGATDAIVGRTEAPAQITQNAAPAPIAGGGQFTPFQPMAGVAGSIPSQPNGGEPAQPQKRHRRTKAEMEAARAAEEAARAAPASPPMPAAQPAAQPAAAPFMQEAAEPTDLTQQLDSFFGGQK